MITIYGEGRGFRVVWLLEELGLNYRLRPVDLLKDISDNAEFLAVNPAGFIPALVDGDVVMVESVAIMQYLMATYGPSPLEVRPDDEGYPLYLQFLMMGEAAFSSSMFYYTNFHRIVPKDTRPEQFDRFIKYQFDSRLDLIRRQVEQTPYLAGDRFTAADVSTVYALDNARRGAGIHFDGAVRDYMARCIGRDSYRRTMDRCLDMKKWHEGLARDGKLPPI